MPRHFKREEDQILAQVIGLLRMHGVPCFHCPNEFDGSVQAASRRQAQGVTAGVPDIIIVMPPPNITTMGHATIETSVDGGRISCKQSVSFLLFVGAALELKREKGRNAEPEQLEWLDRFARARFVTGVTKGLRASLDQLVSWGYLPASVLDLPGTCSAASSTTSPRARSSTTPQRRRRSSTRAPSR